MHTDLTTTATFDAWNGLPRSAAIAAILPCNGSQAWAERLADLRPFAAPEDLLTAADAVWRALPLDSWQQAFDSHPRIGETHAPSATAQSLAWSATEQSAEPNAAVAAALVEANRAYEARFGRIFLVCASGKTPAEMLAILHCRLASDPAAELLEAAEQQRQITQLRLRRWLELPREGTLP